MNKMYIFILSLLTYLDWHLHHYYASLVYAQEEGIRIGIECGKEQERNTLISLIKDGYISPKVAAENLNISIDELDKYL